MPDLIAYEQSMRWYKLACAALFALPIWSFLAIVPITNRLTESDQIGFISLESLFAAGLGLIALQMRKSARTHATDDLQLEGLLKTTVRRAALPISLSEMASAFEGSDDLRTHSSGNEPARQGRPSDRTSPRFRSDVKRVDNSELAKRMESDGLKLRTAKTASGRTQPRVSESAEGTESKVSLSTEEVEWLFAALSKGTEKHLSRAPRVTELSRLVEACVRMGRPNPIMEAAQRERLEVYWDRSHWVFDNCDQPPGESL